MASCVEWRRDEFLQKLETAGNAEPIAVGGRDGRGGLMPNLVPRLLAATFAEQRRAEAGFSPWAVIELSGPPVTRRVILACSHAAQPPPGA